MSVKRKFTVAVLTVLCIVNFMFSAGCGENEEPFLNMVSSTYSFEDGVLMDPAATSNGISDANTDTDTDVNAGADADTDTVESEDDGTVYWVKSGKVWHEEKTCASLSRSTDILSGTIDEAMENGKERVCKRCSG